VILAFASFNFISTQYIPGFGSVTMDEVKQITALVHSAGAYISLSIGGATYPFHNSDLYTLPGDLATNINGVISTVGFDGVDFDIEDLSTSVPADFATQTASLINTLRSLNPSLYITLTTAAQAWTAGLYQQPLLNMTIGNLNAWQPMEYDLWIDASKTYVQQIQYDLNYYMTTWGVPPNKIILGLMCGQDDTDHVLMLQDALNITEFATDQLLKGVMVWDANIDGRGCAGNAPYAYSMGIQTQINSVYRD
jgi:chitinase